VSVLLPTPPAPVRDTTRAGAAGGPMAASTSSMCWPRASRLTSRDSARRSWAAKRSRSGLSMPALGVLTEIGDDLVQGGARAEHPRHAQLLKLAHVGLGDDAADQHADVPKPRLP